MKKNTFKKSNILFLIFIVLLIIPQTRLPIQVFIHKGLALISPKINESTEQTYVETYEWQLIDKDKKVLHFNELKGKVILINFWATWCPPCIAEMPNLQLLYDDYKDEVEFLFVSNESIEVINAFLDKNTYDFKVYKALTDYPNFFNIKSIPRTFLIDKEGNVVIDKTGAANWNSDSVRKVIDSLLNKPSV